MRNAEIANHIAELGTLYEIDGANRFRVIAYKEAAQVIRDAPGSIAEMAKAGTATSLQGIGETIQEKVLALLEEGEIPAARKLKAKYPATLVEVTKIPGLGAKTVRRLYDELGISSLEELEAAAVEQRIRVVRGLGAKVEENVLAELGKLGAGGPKERRLLSEILEVGGELVAALRDSPASDRVELAGSARRRAETCKDIDIVATAADAKALAEVLLRHPLADERGAAGSGGARIVTHNGISVDLRIVPPEEFGNLLQHFTGSKEHNVALRERAQKMGLSVSEHGITDVESGEVTRCDDEIAVYGRLGLAYIEPELRHGGREIAQAAAKELPELIEVGQIRGDLHSHTTLSDGRNSLEEMAAAARGRGYGYLAITDHSATHGFGNDVQPDQLRRRIEEIATYNASAPKGFRLLAGTETNILPDGGVDYGDELLGELDWVVASVHTSFRQGEKKLTDRIISAIEHPLVDCIGHLTGRLLLKREPYDIDVERVIEAAAETGTMLEINGSPRRRDIKEGYARIAAEAGVRIVVTTDAHGAETLANIAYSVATARRAGLGPDQVANSRPWRTFAPLRKRAKQ